MGRINHVGTGYGFIPKGYFLEVRDDGQCRLVVIRGKVDKNKAVGDTEQQVPPETARLWTRDAESYSIQRDDLDAANLRVGGLDRKVRTILFFDETARLSGQGRRLE